MGIREMIYKVRALITVALVLSFGLMSFSFANYDRLSQLAQGQQVFGCATVSSDPILNTDQFKEHPGFKLFEDWGCGTCHLIDRKLVGPALAAVRDHRSDDWLKAMIRNSSALIASGDETAVKIFNEYNQIQMPSHDLSDEEVTSILDYITEASKAYN